MNKKYQFSLITANKESSMNNKSSLIPHPKSNITIETPLVYKKDKKLLNINNSNTNSNSNNNNIYQNEDENNRKKINMNNIYSDIYKNLTNSLEGLFKNIQASPISKSSRQNVSLLDNSENDNIKLEEKLNRTKRELNDIKEKIEEVNKKMIKMKTILNKLKTQKSQTEKDIENLISNKETLEEMYNTEIIMIMNEQQQQSNNNNNDNNNNNNSCSSSSIKVSIEEIQEIDINKFKTDVNQLIKILYNINTDETNKDKNQNKEILDSILNTIDQTYKDFNQKTTNISNINVNEITLNFFYEISKFISKQSQNKYSISSINSLLHYLVKINYISKRIDKSMKFVQKHYKSKKKKINEQLIELTTTLLMVENKKHELLVNSNTLEEAMKNLPKKEKENPKTLDKETENNKNIIEINSNGNKINKSDKKINKNYDKINKSDNKINKSDNKINNKDNDNKIKSIPNLNANNFINTSNTKYKILNISNLKANNLNNNSNNNKSNLFDTDNSSNRVNRNQTFLNDTISNVNNTNDNYNGGSVNRNRNINTNINLSLKRQNLLAENLTSIHRAKNKIYENYINNGINLNEVKTKKQNYSENHNHNIKQRRTNLNGDSDISNIIQKIIISSSSSKNNNSANGIKSIYINSSYINTNSSQNNGNDDNTKLIPNRINNNYINYSYSNNNKNFLNLSRDRRLNNNNSNSNNSIFNNYSISISQTRRSNQKYHFINNETFSSVRDNREQKFSKFQKYLVRSTTNSSNDFHKYYNSMVNINTDNETFFKSYQNKNKQNSVLIINNTNNLSVKRQNTNINMAYNKNRLSILQNKIKKISNFSKKKCPSTNNKSNGQILNGCQSPKHELDNQLKIFKQGSMESFCYFKILGKNNEEKFNPLDNYSSMNPEYLDYIECYLSIDVTSGCLQISPNIPLNKFKVPNLNNNPIKIMIYPSYNNESQYTYRNNNINNNCKKFLINIKLKDLFCILMEKYMKNIVKIHSVFLKHTSPCNNVNGNYIINSNTNRNHNQKTININKLIYLREINEIPMEQNKKIQAALCNFFSFSLILGKASTKIDFVFINFEQFNVWFNTLSSIVNNNIKSAKKCVLSNKSSFILKSKINSSRKLKCQHFTLNYKKSTSNDKSFRNGKNKNNNLIVTTSSKTNPMKKKISFYKK